MKEFYSKRFEIFLNGKWIHPFTWDNTIVYIEKEKAENPKEIEYWNFQTFYDEMRWGSASLWSLRTKETFFRKHPYIVFGLEDEYKITEKNFRPLKTRFTYKKVNMSFAELAKTVPAEVFAEYLMTCGFKNVADNAEKFSHLFK